VDRPMHCGDRRPFRRYATCSPNGPTNS
jgi:hypothetical protein